MGSLLVYPAPCSIVLLDGGFYIAGRRGANTFTGCPPNGLYGVGKGELGTLGCIQHMYESSCHYKNLKRALVAVNQ